MQNIELSIIIVTYNCEKYIKNCLDSILKYCSDVNYELIVFDNDSNDNTINIIESDYTKVKLIRSQSNLGFAKGNNEAVNVSKGKYILLLNHDTILLNNISKALKIVEKDDKIGALGIKMLNQNKIYESSVGKFPTPFKLIKFSLFNEKSAEFISGNFNSPETLRKVDWITGAFLLTRKKYWDEVEGLDEKYFMYVEDVDFCKKINLIGKQVVFLPSLSFIHFIGFNRKREILLIKGYRIYANKFYKKHNKLIAKSCLFINYGYKKAIKGFY
jgi:GT2 family glycosyltransferase